MPPSVAIRPRSVSELVDASFQVLRGSFGQMLLLSTVVIIPNLALGLVNRSLLPSLIDARGRLLSDNISLTSLIWVVPLSILGLCWFFVGMGALVQAASDAFLGNEVDPPRALRRSAARAIALVCSNLLAYLLIMLAAAGLGIAAVALSALFALAGVAAGAVAGIAVFVAVIVLVLVVVARYFVITPVIMLEQRGAIDALRRSVLLTEGRRLKIAGLMVLLFALALVMLMTIFFVAGGVLGNPYATSAIASLFWLPVYPLGAAIVTLLYYDLRIRKEAYDIELMASGLGGPPSQAA